MALAVPDQCAAGNRRRAVGRLGRGHRSPRLAPPRLSRSARSAAARSLSRQFAAGSQGSPSSRLGQPGSTAAGRYLLLLRRWCDLALFAPFGAADRSGRIPRPQFCGRVLLQLCSRHRPLRGNISVAGVSRSDPKLRRTGDRRDHDGDRRRPAGDGAGRHDPRTARRAPAADRRGLCPARCRPGRQRLHDLRDRFLGIVLAAARPRCRHHAVSVADHRAGIERLRPRSMSRMRAACST